MTAVPEVLVEPDDDAVAATVATELVETMCQIQEEGRIPSVVLTGGSIAAKLHAAVLDVPRCSDVDWSRVEVWFGDERFVPADDPERNAEQAWDALLSHVPVDPKRVHEMPASDGAYGDDVEAAAAGCAQEIASTLGEHPSFDVLMLGVGPDGHCASLFPGHEAVHAGGLAVGVRESPKPPPVRISLTMEVLRCADEVWFVAAGAAKARAVHDALTEDDVAAVPASGPRGRERTRWFLDEAAASRLDDVRR